MVALLLGEACCKFVEEECRAAATMAQLLSAFRPQAVFSSKSSMRGAALQCSTAKAVAPAARSSLVVEGERSGRSGGPAGGALWSKRRWDDLRWDMRGGPGQWLGAAGRRPPSGSTSLALKFLFVALGWAASVSGGLVV